MIVILKKQNFIIIICILIITVMCAGLLLKNNTDTSVNALPYLGKTVVLDAGHGYPDGGAVGLSGTEEDALNLEVTLFLQGFLEKSGINVILTRADENGIFDENKGNIKNKKLSDMKNREKIMNESGADIFVSIHMNKFTDSKYSGPQVFYSANLEEGKLLAETVQKELIAELKPKMEREIKKAGSGIYLLKNAELPAVLVECGFLSNPDEERLLKTAEYRKRTAWAIYKGIITYFSQ